MNGSGTWRVSDAQMLLFISFGVSGPLLSPERSDYESRRPDSVLTHLGTQRNILRCVCVCVGGGLLLLS